MNFDDEAKAHIIKWVDTQITFNPDRISPDETKKFFQSLQKVYFPENVHIEIHSTLLPDDCRFSWSVYLCTSVERFTQFKNTLFVPNARFDVLWADFVLKSKKHIVQIKITADTVNNIVVVFE